MSRSSSAPNTVEHPKSGDQMALHLLASATSANRSDFSLAYGSSISNRRPATAALPSPAVASSRARSMAWRAISSCALADSASASSGNVRSEEHTSELQSPDHLV